MKKFKKILQIFLIRKFIKPLLVISILLSLTSLFAQDTEYNRYLQVSPRIGFDFPTYDNNTPFIDYKGGIDIGLSVDYYWNWIGIGLDFDYIKNRPESIYPTHNLFHPINHVSLTSFNLTEENITRVFYGIGPDFKYQTNNERFTAEFNTRFGFASIVGGKVMLQETSSGLNDVLNFHAGYDQKSVFSFKGQLRFTYFFSETKNLGVHLGAYYLKHFDVEESSVGGISAEYWPFTVIVGEDATELNDGGSIKRTEACNCGIKSLGVFAGLSFRWPHKQKNELLEYSLAITAKDKYTEAILPNTDIAVKDVSGNIIQTGTTNSYGIIVFDNIVPDNYVISGVLNSIDLEGASVLKSEFEPNSTLQKIIYYTDMNFILKGNVVECNTVIPIQGVSVILNNVNIAEQKNTITDKDGLFVFHVKKQADYTIYGKKDSYFSQTETISTTDYDRNATLFIVLEICMEKTDCGKAITLKNIHYDLDKDLIRDDAKPELQRLAQFMIDNPDISIEISSHTDSRASNEYNLDLSQRRANKAIEYLVSLGISRDLLTGVGYGETKLLNECADGVQCTEGQHQLNRRTEFKVICPK